MTFKNANENLEVAKEIPLDKLLIETDSPFLTPQPYRGKNNESSYVKYVGEKLAKLKNLDNFTVQSQLFDNYQRLFKWLKAIFYYDIISSVQKGVEKWY